MRNIFTPLVFYKRKKLTNILTPTNLNRCPHEHEAQPLANENKLDIPENTISNT